MSTGELPFGTVRSAAGMGNAVHVGYGYWLTAQHVLMDHTTALIEIGGAERCAVLVPTRLQGRDVALLEEAGAAGGSAAEVAVSRLDRSGVLTVRGFLRGQAEPLRLSGTVGQSWRDLPGGIRARELRLSERQGGTLRSLSGSGVFDGAGRLVGMVVAEAGEPWDVLYFAPLDDWPRLRGEPFPVGAWVEAYPVPWQDQLSPVQARLGHLFEREEILRAFAERRDGEGARGYLLLTGGAQQGKSGVMYRLFHDEWEQRDGEGILCAFGKRPVTHLQVIEALADQLRYLVEGAELPADSGRETTAGGETVPLMRLLHRWSAAGRRLTIYVDALDEISGASELPFLGDRVPPGVVVIASLRHEPVRKRAVTRAVENPCLGWLNLDGGADPELPPGRSLLPDEAVTASNAAACDRIWERWQDEERHRDRHPLSPALREAIRERLGDIPGWNAYYADRLRETVEYSGALPAPGAVPKGPGELLEKAWEDDVETGSEARRARNLRSYGLVAFARRHLPMTTVRRLLGNPAVERFNRDLEDVWRHVHRYGEAGDERLVAFHETWNELVRTKISGSDRTAILRLLAYGTEDWSIEDADEDYALHARPYHLLALRRDEETAPAARRKAESAWLEVMGDPVYLARRVDADGIDLLLADIAQGSAAGVPDGPWLEHFEILDLYADALRRE